MEGWIKLHRKILENPVVMKDAESFAIWTYLLLNASHKDHPAIFKGEKITLHAGQLITGRKSIAKALSVNESKVYRVLEWLKSEHQIEQLTSARNSLITIVNWADYQQGEQLNEQLANSYRTASEQLANTNKNVKNKKNKRNNNSFNNFSQREYDFNELERKLTVI